VKKLDLIKRLGSPATDLQTFAEWGIPVNPEICDINVNITTDQTEMNSDMKELLRGTYSTFVMGKLIHIQQKMNF
jgi:hypothetical protein